MNVQLSDLSFFASQHLALGLNYVYFQKDWGSLAIATVVPALPALMLKFGAPVLQWPLANHSQQTAAQQTAARQTPVES